MPKLAESYLGSPDNPGTAGLVCYITPIGWLIAYFGLYRSNPVPFAAFHLRQTLLLHCFSLLVNTYTMIAFLNALPQWMVMLPAVLLTVLWLWGLLDAVNKGQHPVPLVGRWAQHLFRKI